MLDLNQLHTFVTLARLQHFGQAASALHMTQPNVSLQLKNLEQVTKAKLIERAPFRLTPAGERLLASASLVLDELQLCQSDLNALAGSQGALAIAASDMLSRRLLIAPLQQLKQAFAGIDLRLYNTTSDQAAELVKRGKADLGLVLAQPRVATLSFTPLAPVPWCAVGDGLRRWQAQAAGAPRVGHDEPTLILLGEETRTHSLLAPYLPRLGLGAYRVMAVDSVDAQLDWASAGFGVAIVPELALSSVRSREVACEVLGSIPPTPLGYVVRQDQVLSRPIKQLLLWIEAQMRQG
ncbi:MAG: LysR family transcriptional regulator [Aeromonas sp.]